MMSRMAYSVTSATTPAPTVRPPSRIANRSSFSLATGVISSIAIVTLSPALTISTPPRSLPLPPRRQRAHPRHVRRPEIKLRPVPVEKRRVPPPLLLRQHVYLRLAPLVRRDRPRLRQHLPPLHFLLVHPPQQTPHIVPRLPLVQQLPKHLHPRHHRLARLPKPHDLHLLPHLHHPPLPPPRHHRPSRRTSRPARN